jgi:hypothetical protein
MPVVRTQTVDRRVQHSTYLSKFKRNVYSQAGEDGIVDEIFRIMGTKNKWCVEFGAWDGIYLSNTCNLIRNQGWSAVHIEGDPKKCDEIRSNYPDNDKVVPLCRMVGFTAGADTIDDLLKTTDIPKDFDFISIDVDGVDWHIWSSIVVYRPRLVVIEFNPTVPNDVVFIQDRDMAINEGCSLAALIELGKSKKYELVALTNGNAFFVVEEEFEKFKIKDNSIHAMRLDRPNFIFNCYNGKVYNTLPRLAWYGKHVPMFPDSLQLLAEFRFHGHLQGKADDCGRRALDEKPSERDLSSADGILREVYELRTGRKQLNVEEFASRSKLVWAAAKSFMDRHRVSNLLPAGQADQPERSMSEAEG